MRKLLAVLALAVLTAPAHSALVTVANPSFEADEPNANEFFLGAPDSWSPVDPNGLLATANNVVGTLDTALSSDFFVTGAPDGDDVAIVFIGASEGGGEVGLAQTLTAPLAANTRYDLAVDVGNIQSGQATDGTFFNLDGFPGYRVELRAGGTLLAQASAGSDAGIAEGTFATVSLSHTTESAPTALGEALEIRLLSRNLVDPTASSADSEVDFDDVRLTASPVPLPGAIWLLAGALLGLRAPAALRRWYRT